MLWTPTQQFHPWPFDKEAELEATIAEVKTALFGESRIYLDVKKLIGEKGRTQNIPDGYLLDLSSPRKPVLYLVEVELARHDPLRHIAQQLLNFSLSFKSTPHAREGGFKETFPGENMWRTIRIHSSMIPKLRYLAAYQVAPVSAITHVAEVSKIEVWKDQCRKNRDAAQGGIRGR